LIIFCLKVFFTNYQQFDHLFLRVIFYTEHRIWQIKWLFIVVQGSFKQTTKQKTLCFMMLSLCFSVVQAAEQVDSTNNQANNAVSGLSTSSEQGAFGAKKSLFSNNQSTSTPKMLSPDQAFKFKPIEQKDKVLIGVSVIPNYYVYEQKFSVSAEQGLKVGKISYDQKAEFEEDPEFGKVPVFHRDVNLTVPVQGNGQLILNWQGCAKNSVCYPPQQFKFKVGQQAFAKEPTIEKATAPVAPTAASNATAATSSKTTPVKITPLGSSAPIVATPLPEFNVAVSEPELTASDTPTANPQAAVAPQNSMVSDPFGLVEYPLLALGLLFLAGLGLAFTPCVLPMLPIVANLVATQHRRSAGHGLALSGAYAVGVASCYAMLGAVIALFGHQINLITWSQHPAVLISFAVVFALLALHSFEVFQIKLPYFLRAKIERVGRVGQSAKWSGSILGCLIAGFFSALIVSPCLSAPLAGVLLSVSTVGNPWLGAAALFCLGIGLGVPLMILGATEGKFLPKAGTWLNWVRRGFGLLLFGVALLLLNRVFDNQWMLLLWAVLAVFFALWFWVWHGRGWLITKILAMVAGIWTLLLIGGAFTGATDPVRPWSALLTSQTQVQPVATIHTLAELAQYQQQYPRLLVDVTADWCIACKIIERDLFQTNPAAELQTWNWVKLDVTKTNDDSRAVLTHLNIFGPPALIFYQDGQMVEQVLGEPKREEFVVVLKRHK
jgi:thiol:disulfide interchange protein DsbD